MPKGKNHLSIYGALKHSAINMSPLQGEKMLNAFALGVMYSFEIFIFNNDYCEREVWTDGGRVRFAFSCLLIQYGFYCILSCLRN